MIFRKRVYLGLLLCVVVAVWGLKSFCIESYRVPEGEMEQSLFSGERIVVTKWDYGIRMPQTLLRWPFFHDSLPFLQCRSYSRALQLPFFQFRKRSPRRNDIVVFYLPQPDDLRIPIDCRKIGISRCIGLPGDTLIVADGVLKINSSVYEKPSEVKEAYYYRSNDSELVINAINRCGMRRPKREQIGNKYLTFLTWADYRAIVQQIGSDSILQPVVRKSSARELLLPRAGYPVSLDSVRLSDLYPLIKEYEDPRAELRDGQLYIDGKRRFSYVFKNDYYWMLSDNRDEGCDSRRFGAVPHTHLIGKARYIWWSVDRSKPLLYSFSFHRIFKGID